jgi:hypothetical protein
MISFVTSVLRVHPREKRLLESWGCISGRVLAKLVLRSLMKPIKVSQDLT